ncbi:MAG: hypothetical protein ACRCXB_26775 [Aeromonadaceae bacterium]
MDSMNLMPVGESGWGTGGAAAIGAFVGSWFGNGGFGPYGRAGAGVVAAEAVGNEVVLEAINGVGLAVVNGQNNTNMAITRAAADVYTGLNNTLTQQLLSNQQGFASVQSTLCQGFSGLNQSVYQSGVDTRFSINALGQQMAECCCETQKAIAAEGSATRALINERYIGELQTQLCDAKAKIGSLESNIYLSASQQAQTQQIIQTVLAHLPAKS